MLVTSSGGSRLFPLGRMVILLSGELGWGGSVFPELGVVGADVPDQLLLAEFGGDRDLP